MTRKCFVKLLMAEGFSRNYANFTARLWASKSFSYEEIAARIWGDKPGATRAGRRLKT